MSLEDDEVYSPSGAWIATGVGLATLPICLYPLVQAVRRSTSTGEESRSTRFSHVIRSLAREWVWMAMTLSHGSLTLYGLFSATETGCECNRIYEDCDYGWDSLRPNCFRNLLLFASNLAECLIAPVYPFSMLMLYMQLVPSNKRKRFRPLVKALVSLQAFLSVVLFTATFIYWADIWTSDKGLLAMSLQTSDAHDPIFHAWFALMIACGCVSLILNTRLLPHLQVKPSTCSSLISAPTPRVSVALPKPDAAARQVKVFVRRLQICIVLVLVLLTINFATVSMQVNPSVLRVTIGWVSCHCISFALYMAMRLVKQAVLARRMVPQSAAGTLAKSGWSGADGSDNVVSTDP